MSSGFLSLAYSTALSRGKPKKSNISSSVQAGPAFKNNTVIVIFFYALKTLDIQQCMSPQIRDQQN